MKEWSTDCIHVFSTTKDGNIEMCKLCGHSRVFLYHYDIKGTTIQGKKKDDEKWLDTLCQYIEHKLNRARMGCENGKPKIRRDSGKKNRGNKKDFIDSVKIESRSALVDTELVIKAKRRGLKINPLPKN